MIINEKNGVKYIDCSDSKIQITIVNDVLEVLSNCYVHSTNRILLEAENFHEDFFNLKTGLAGEILQKFRNYNIKAALIIPQNMLIKGKISEMFLEENRGSHFRTFDNKNDSEDWLISD